MKRTLLFSIIIGVIATQAMAQNNPKITRVFEYRPAPGQHINRLFPKPEMSDTYVHALQFARERLVDNKAIVGLGAFGGYVVVGFDHPIVNVEGEYDFKGLGNSFTNSHEPGIVMVCQDVNKNGVPDADEPWYELAGSEYNHPETVKKYEITYYRPEGKKQDVRWTDNQGGEGSVKHISYATQDYMYPIWVNENMMTFKGTKLRNTARNTSTDPNKEYWVMDAFDYGYIDNNPNSDPITKNGFKIDWAVDEKGNSVTLAYIDFIKVYTAQVQEAGWLGETSTEFGGIIDLHPDEWLPSVIDNAYIEKIKVSVQAKKIIIQGGLHYEGIAVMNAAGMIVSTSEYVGNLLPGFYVVKVTSKNHKIFTQKIHLK